MKKYLFIASFVFCVFFLGFGNVNASTKLGIDFDSNEHFNYYFEQKNNTSFYNLLNDSNTFKSKIGLNSDNTGGYVYIFKPDDINYSLNKNPNNIDFGLAKYFVIRYTASSFSVTSSGDTYTLTSIDNSSFTVYAFNEDAELIGSFTNNFYNCNTCGNISLKNSITYELNSNKKEYADDFSYFTSLFYNNSSAAITASDKYIVTDIYYENEHFVIEDSDNYSSFLAKWRNFWSAFTNVDDLVSAVDLGLDYYKTYPISKGKFFPTLINIIDLHSTFSIPDGFQQKILDNEKSALFFFPKNINDSTLNRYFYTSTTESIYTNKVSVWLNTYDLIDKSTPYDNTKLGKISYSSSNKLYKINVNKYLHKIDTDLDVTDYITAFTLQSYKYEPSIYYNPSAYSVCVYIEDDSSNTCTYTNSSGDSITLSHNDMYNILSQNDSIGISSNVLDSVDKQCETAKNYSELYEYDEDCNIVGAKQDGGLAEFFANLSDITKWIAGFTAVITTIFSYFALFFTSLPAEIRACLLFGFIGGTIILLYKLIRG